MKNLEQILDKLFGMGCAYGEGSIYCNINADKCIKQAKTDILDWFEGLLKDISGFEGTCTFCVKEIHNRIEQERKV